MFGNKTTKTLYGISRLLVERLPVNVHMQSQVPATLFQNGGLNNVEREKEKKIKLEHLQTNVFTAVPLASDAFIEYRYCKKIGAQ